MMKRMASAAAVMILVAMSSAGSAGADPDVNPSEFPEKCRTTTFRLEHPNLCSQYYGGGGTLPGDRNNKGGKGILGGLLGGLTGGLL